MKGNGSVEILVELIGVYATLLGKGGTHKPTKTIFLLKFTRSCLNLTRRTVQNIS
jgi:hypothetical protein